MIELNLLPWRDHARAQKRKKYLLLAIGISVCISIFIASYFIFLHKKEMQPPIIPQEKFVRSSPELRQLQQIKFVGFLRQGHQQVALLMSPTRDMMDVQVGDEVGRTKARVLSISEQRVVVVLPDHHRHVISRNNKGSLYESDM
jgi:Tfp pilus assembly protein PilP